MEGVTMPLPLVPIAGVALSYGLVALGTWAIVRSIGRTPRDQRAEDALDDLPEGLTAGKHEDATRGSARLNRTIRIGTDGPGVEIDLTALGRLKVKRVGRGGS
jgi:hypothetical protein